MQRSYERWDSAQLGRPMEFLWFGWSGFPVICFPTSLGRFYQYEDMGTVARLADKIDAGFLQVVCVDSVDAESWYAEGADPAASGRRQEQYDAYLRSELMPYVRSRAQRDDAGVFGCSFGAYHAANFAGRHPDLVTKAVCFSGVYDIHRFLGGYWDETDYYNCPTAYIPNMDPEWTARLAAIDWVIATGEYDSLADENRNFSRILREKGIPNHCEIWPGVFGHDWSFWNDAVVRLL
jgi:esterase/lipase superfamily enzyme